MSQNQKYNHQSNDKYIDSLFDIEIASSERLRALILIGLLGLEALLLMVIYFFWLNRNSRWGKEIHQAKIRDTR
jgi:hypothetical protein